jgi:hypothetical protein
MATTQTWQAFLVRDEAHWQFLGLSPWPDQLLRWCRQSLRRLTGRDNDGGTEVVLYRCDDRPNRGGRKPRFRPFGWKAPPQEGWLQEKVFQHPFEELLGNRERSSSNGKAKVRGRKQSGGRRAVQSQAALCATAFDESSGSIESVEPGVAEAYNKLLSWLSAAGTGRREAFLRTCQVLGLVYNGSQARRIIRRLILLGHLSDDGVRWTMHAPTLGPLAREPERVVLRGQRTSGLLACLPENREQTSQADAPDRITCCLPVETGSTAVCIAGTSFRIEQDGLSRARTLPDLRAWAESLKRFEGRDLGKFVRTERWNGVTWAGTPLYYDHAQKRTIGPAGMYRLTQDVCGRSPLTVCFDEVEQRIMRGEWYGLRFLASRMEGETLHAEWAEAGNEFFVPTEKRWPLLYEQMLVQASGLLPSRSRRPGWLCYQGVPENLAGCLCKKLDIELDPAPSSVERTRERAAT